MTTQLSTKHLLIRDPVSQEDLALIFTRKYVVAVKVLEICYAFHCLDYFSVLVSAKQ